METTTSQIKIPEGFSVPNGYTLVPPNVKCYLLMAVSMVLKGQQTPTECLIKMRDSRLEKPWIEEKQRFGLPFPLSLETTGGNASETKAETLEETLQREVYEETGTFLKLSLEEISKLKKTVVYEAYENDEKKTYAVNEKHIYFKRFGEGELNLVALKKHMKDSCEGKIEEVEKLPTFDERLAFKEKIQPLMIPEDELFFHVKKICKLNEKLKLTEDVEEKNRIKKEKRLLNYFQVYDIDGTPFFPDMIREKQTGEPNFTFMYKEEIKLAEDHMRITEYNAIYLGKAYDDLKKIIGFNEKE